MEFYVRDLPQRLVRLPSRAWLGVDMFTRLGVGALLERDWIARQPAVLGASLLLVILLFSAGVQLEKLHALAALAILSLPVGILLVSGE